MKLVKVPPVTVTSALVKSVEASLNVNVIVAVSPTFNALSSVVIATVGAVVSPVGAIGSAVKVSWPSLANLKVDLELLFPSKKVGVVCVRFCALLNRS